MRSKYESWIPPQVKLLAERERQLAMIIYSRGPSTAKEIEGCLFPKITNAAVRSMLVRLVAKGILDRCAGKRGPGQQYVYVPKIRPEQLKKQTLLQIAEKYFDGSLLSVAMSALEMIEGLGQDDQFRVQGSAIGQRGTADVFLPIDRAA